MTANCTAICHIFILKADRMCAEALWRNCHEVFPFACIAEARLIADARRWFAEMPIDLLVAGTTMLDGDTGELLAACGGATTRPGRVLIVTGSKQPRVLERLRALPVAGIFDSSGESAPMLALALRTVAAGRTYWSKSVLEGLDVGLASAHRICRCLTLTEQLVLSVIGDGSDDAAAAGRLGLKPSAVQSVRRNLHHKLGVQQKGDLIRFAAQHDYVRFTAEGVVRPGFAQLLAEWQAHHRASAIPLSGKTSGSPGPARHNATVLPPPETAAELMSAGPCQ